MNDRRQDEPAASADFMARGYDLIQEPLNLLETGRRWFSDACALDAGEAGRHGLVLGATPWLGALLARTHRHVTLIDASETMLGNARRALASCVNATCVRGSWQSLPAADALYDTVVSDNGFSYLPFPDDWVDLCNELASRMRPGARLAARILSVPTQHRSETVDEIVARFAAREQINYTEVRAALLFSQWRKTDFGIDTEAVLRTYEGNAAAFETLLGRCAEGEPNDLVTIQKYRGAGAMYYAPPLDEWLGIVRQRFRVEGVHFGPYAMSDYFPLVSAVRV